MKITLDAQMLFDEQALEISPGSFSRDSIERTVHGLDGVLVEGWNLGWDGNWLTTKGAFDFVTPHPDFDIEQVALTPGGDLELEIDDEAIVPQINAGLVAAGFEVGHLAVREETLEDIEEMNVWATKACNVQITDACK